jgi:hypothetical protein
MKTQNQDYAAKYAAENQIFDAKSVVVDNGTTYIPAIMANDYLTDILKTPFGVPVNKTILLWAKQGKIPALKKLGKTNYVDINALKAIVKK